MRWGIDYEVSCLVGSCFWNVQYDSILQHQGSTVISWLPTRLQGLHLEVGEEKEEASCEGGIEGIEYRIGRGEFYRLQMNSAV